MLDSDRERFSTLLSALAATFRAEASEALFEGYWMALDDMPLEAIERAVRAAMRSCEWMPMASELRKLGGEMAIDGRAVLAWGAVQKAIGQHGYYRSVDFDDPVINATVRNLGGWMKFCTTETEEAKWLRKDFERIYASLCASGVSLEAIAYLPGRHEQDNAAKGYNTLPPVKVSAGLPPHTEGTVRELSAPERLVLAGPASSSRPDVSLAPLAALVKSV